MDPRIPDKQYFKIGEVAKIAGLKPSVLRFWETEFSAIKPEKSRTNQRMYARKHVERILQIKELLYERKFTIAGAKRHLKSAATATPAAPPPLAKAPSGPTFEKVKKELKELLRMIDEPLRMG